MSGGAFNYYQYHIDDIIARIEEEIKSATCERPPLLTKQGVSVLLIESPTCKSYCNGYRFESFERAVESFMQSPHYELLTGGSREGETEVRFRDRFSDEIFEVRSYTYQEYEPVYDEDGFKVEPYYPDYTPETIQEFRNAVGILKSIRICSTNRLAHIGRRWDRNISQEVRRTIKRTGR